MLTDKQHIIDALTKYFNDYPMPFLNGKWKLEFIIDVDGENTQAHAALLEIYNPGKASNYSACDYKQREVKHD